MSSMSSKSIKKRIWQKRSAKKGDNSTLDSISKLQNEEVEGTNDINDATDFTLAQSQDESFSDMIKRLCLRAEKTYNRGEFDLALSKFQALRGLVASSPAANSTTRNVDAKAAFYMGMIHEFGLKDFQEAQSCYKEALQHYRNILQLLSEQHEASSLPNHALVKDEFIRRICKVLLRLSVTSGNLLLWEDALQHCATASQVLSALNGERSGEDEMDKLGKEIHNQIFLCKVMLEGGNIDTMWKSIKEEHEQLSREEDRDAMKNIGCFRNALAMTRESYFSFFHNLAPGRA